MDGKFVLYFAVHNMFDFTTINSDDNIISPHKYRTCQRQIKNIKK